MGANFSSFTSHICSHLSYSYGCFSLIKLKYQLEFVNILKNYLSYWKNVEIRKGSIFGVKLSCDSTHIEKLTRVQGMTWKYFEGNFSLFFPHRRQCGLLVIFVLSTRTSCRWFPSSSFSLSIPISVTSFSVTFARAILITSGGKWKYG